MFLRNQSIYQIRQLLDLPIYKNKVSYLNKQYVLEWLFADKSFIKSLTPKFEKEWGQKTIGYKTNQWTTKLGESILHDILTINNKYPEKIVDKKRGENGKRLDPDRDAVDGLYENKTRTYTVTGTAGEKILGTPLKYCECYKLYEKPLYIVCMAYQEVEAIKDFKLFDTTAPERMKILEFIETELHIKFIRATDMLLEFLDENRHLLNKNNNKNNNHNNNNHNNNNHNINNNMLM